MWARNQARRLSLDGAPGDGPRTRCFTRNGHDWGDRFPAIVFAGLGQLAAVMLIGFLPPRRTVP